MSAMLLHRRTSANVISVLFCLCMALTALPAIGADYFVNKQGSNANARTSHEATFQTIKKGVAVLQPGDTLTIGPGEYFENVERSNLGNADVDTIIRAEIPGATLMRGDVDLPELKKVEGHRFVYAVAFDTNPLGILKT